MSDDRVMKSKGISSDEPMPGETQLSSPKRWLPLPLSVHLRHGFREPLVHFLLIGLVLFAVYTVLNLDSGPGGSLNQIVLTESDLQQLQIAFAAQWQRPPVPEELAGLINSRVREEILYREALALGLDKEDTIVKRRMAQKMEFLAEDLSDLHEPTTEALIAWFEKNSQRFALPARVTFSHLYFSPDSRGQRAHDDAVTALAKIAGQPEDSKLAASLADQFMFQDYYGDRTQEQLLKEFGPNFAQSLFQLKPGSWEGPIESGYGWHLIWIDSITPSRVPQFEEVDQDVRSAWIAEQRAETKRKMLEAMEMRYEVVLPPSTGNGMLSVNLPSEKEAQ
jgi:peptidyl-prolyl cis-trans isomerase C